jgi:hypothetical protein
VVYNADQSFQPEPYPSLAHGHFDEAKKWYKDISLKYIFMLKPKQLFININFNVCVKRVHPHKTNNNILFRYEKIPKIQFIRPTWTDESLALKWLFETH